MFVEEDCWGIEEAEEASGRRGASERYADRSSLRRGFNGAMNKYWDYLNRGRQWKDIRARYVEAADEDDE
ncbi:hypothetical protein GCG54_00004070 [Colletotrichum gloeosporioides]|uniref:Complex III subunit 9 n=2 Tax=Colletotrichum gloeosporioides TaxID=474922 RepID=T0LE37_COLGC|nr:uncharacterized protein GCG54_00004070 [Colletotrichum gloeosporioides]EQB46625.1 ubiquinol-cytochrome C reductase [Colletotrichum gloeosporioides Cg-14]KAF3804801.1 hypothetical protein GCG54_00004070 [Colletotrichum gloeosporioides]